MLSFSALLSCACAPTATTAARTKPAFDVPMPAPFWLFPARRPAMCALLRHVADRLDLEPAVERSAAGLDARPGGQRLAAAEIAAVDAIESLGVALVAQPHDDLQQAIHARPRGL